MKVIGIILFLLCILVNVVTSSTGANGIVILIIGTGALISCWRYKNPKKKLKEEQTAQKNKFDAAQNQLQSRDFVLSKSISIPDGGFFVDDINKKFASSQNGIIRIFDYTDLGEFELNEDGNSIAQGRGMATAVGGMTFGVMGALVGNSGKRKQQNTCSSLIVRIMVNDLQNPQIIVPYISKEINKKTPLYKELFEKSKEFISVLHYIEKQSTVN